MASATTETDPSLVDATAVVRRVGSHPDRGLSAHESAERLFTVGPHEIATAKPVSSWRKLVAQFRDPQTTAHRAPTSVTVHDEIPIELRQLLSLLQVKPAWTTTVPVSLAVSKLVACV